ncbi:MAG: hypothetical protein LBS49_14105 [Candidatus Accumulibacter sp.]|nr:hypothetical protein [Accumulibacter sp.]
MPAINLSITRQGPPIRAFVGVSRYREMALKKRDLPAPRWTEGNFLIDTGASGTCIDSGLLEPLNIPPTGVVSVQTPSTGATPRQCDQYDVMLYLPGTDQAREALHFPAAAVLETSLASQGIDGLLGRDVLDNCVFIYNASLRIFTLAY